MKLNDAYGDEIELLFNGEVLSITVEERTDSTTVEFKTREDIVAIRNYLDTVIADMPIYKDENVTILDMGSTYSFHTSNARIEVAKDIIRERLNTW